MEDEEAGRELMRQTSAAILLGYATAKVPALAPVVVSVTPLAAAAATAIGRIGRRREENAAETLAEAVKASGDPPEEFINKATADDRRIELLTRALVIAQDTALREKRRALGRALANGIAGDNARIDEELLFLRAVADVDAPHIKLLARLANGRRSGASRGYWHREQITTAMPELGNSWYALMAPLEVHGLVDHRQSSALELKESFMVTHLGYAMLARLAEDADGT